MIRIILLASLALATGIAQADTNVGASSVSGANVETQTAAQAQLSGNQSSVELTSIAPDKQTVEYKGNVGNTPVGLAAATSFSSDYCGGTGSAGASGWGVSIGGSKVSFDSHCQHLRSAEKWGLAAVTLRNLGHNSESANAATMMIYELCTANADSVEGCKRLGLVHDAK